MFKLQLSVVHKYKDNILRSVFHFVGMNIHYENQQQSTTKQTFTTITFYSHVLTNKPTYYSGHILDMVVVDTKIALVFL